MLLFKINTLKLEKINISKLKAISSFSASLSLKSQSNKKEEINFISDMFNIKKDILELLCDCIYGSYDKIFGFKLDQNLHELNTNKIKLKNIELNRLIYLCEILGINEDI